MADFLNPYLQQTEAILLQNIKKIEEAITNPDSPSLDRKRVEERLKDEVSQLLALKQAAVTPIGGGLELLRMTGEVFRSAGEKNVRTLTDFMSLAKKELQKESIDLLFKEGSFAYQLLLDAYGITEEGLESFLSSSVTKNKEFNWDLMFFVQHMFKADILISIVCYNNEDVIERLHKLQGWKHYYLKIKEVLDALPPITIG